MKVLTIHVPITLNLASSLLTVIGEELENQGYVVIVKAGAGGDLEVHAVGGGD